MDADLFLQQFGHLAQGHGGIKKLRDVILQLAVRGKLVEQNPADEPAEMLLKKILKKKDVVLGKSKLKSLHRTLANETTHDLPSSWVHTTLDELGVINPRNDYDATTVAGFVPMTLVSERYGVFPRYEERNWIEISKGYTHFVNDDVGLAKITPCFENSKSCVFRDLPNGIGAGTTELHIFRDVTKTIVPAYVWIWIKSPEFLLEGERRMTGSAGQKRIPKDYFALKPFPLAPLAEQKRVVAKVDELMALCDKLEAEQQKQRTLKTQAVQSTLHHLTDPENASTFDASFTILNSTFNHWFDDLKTLKHLRATILELAVQGKLVPQDVNDEPASELIRRIEAEKKRLIKEGKIKKLISHARITHSECPYEIPASWGWTILPDVVVFKSGHTIPKEEELSDGQIPYVKVGDMNIPQNNVTISTSSRFVNDFSKYKTMLIEPYSIIFPKRGGAIATNKKKIVCKPIIVDLNTMALTPYCSDIFAYFKIWFDTINLGELNNGTSVPQINNKDFERFPIPLPPLAEQKRIVAKVDELMTLCDQLESDISTAQCKNPQLMDALVYTLLQNSEVSAQYPDQEKRQCA